MCPSDDSGGEPREVSLFEQWMGITFDAWEELGSGEDMAMRLNRLNIPLETVQ